MEHGSGEPEPARSGSFGGTSSAGSSFRARSLSLSRNSPFHLNDCVERANASEAVDIGDSALRVDKRSDDGSIRFSFGNAFGDSGGFPIPVDDLLQSYGSRAMESTALSTSPVSPLPEEIISPLSTDAIIHSKGKSQEKEEGLALPPLSDYLSCLLYLAAFGILGVLTRYLLQKLFGPDAAGVTSDDSPLYLDLPSNMEIYRGSLIIWQIGLTTGYLGSLTTFSGWNQKMLDLVVDGHWVLALAGFFVGLFLAAYSIIFGVKTANHFKLLVERLNRSGTNGTWRVDSCKRHLTTVVVLTLILVVLWSVLLVPDTTQERGKLGVTNFQTTIL